MNTQYLWMLFAGAAIMLLSATGAPAAGMAGGDVLMAWEFNTGGDLQGWVTHNHLRDVQVAGGMLSVTVQDWDPFVTHEVFQTPLVATPTQVIEVRMMSPVEGTAEFFWTNTTETKYEGFSPGKETMFDVKPGWHVYRLRPFWQAEKKIIKLRLDLPGIKKGDEPERTYQIDYIRIIELGAAESVPANWTFARGLEGWHLEGEGHLRAGGGWLVADLEAGDRLVAPTINVDAERDVFIGFVMAVDRGKSARVLWASDGRNGLQHLDFPVIADGKPHVYNVPMGEDRGWAEKIIYIALQPSLDAACDVKLDWLRTAADPVGPPEVQVRSFLLSDALPRTGRPCEVTAQLINRGGEAAKGLQVELLLPKGVKMAQGGARVRTISVLDYWEPQNLTWHVVGSEPGRVRLRLRVSGDVSAHAAVTDTLLPPLNLPKADYVPRPVPAGGDYDVGVYYFPGWSNWARWQPIMDYPERKPILGWYREGSPEVADWHIKWAVEHGITFFCYDWYWNQGNQSLTHALHDGYFNARYRNLLKFCLLWANHAGAGQHTPEDNVNVCKYWIDNYFKRPEYFKLNGRPLVVIFSVGSMKRDLGIDGTREAVELWHKMTREAGVGEILVAGCGSPGQLEEMKQMGFDAVTGYNWPRCGVGGRNYVPYIEVARKQFDLWWMPMAQKNLMPVIVPTSPGWDARPWQKDRAFVLTDRTPQAFQEHLQLAKRFIDETGQPKVALIEAWNEWGEGSYCEPHKEYGFGHLDAVRKVFCPDAGPHQDYGPQDVGLGPYDLKTPSLTKTAWEFNTDGDAEGWGPMMGLTDFKVTGGAMHARATSNDPAFSCGVRLRAAKVSAIEVAMAVRGAASDDLVHLFWASNFQGVSESTSLIVPIVTDSKMHIYRFDVRENPLWRGIIKLLRLDPCVTKDALVEVDYIRALP